MRYAIFDYQRQFLQPLVATLSQWTNIAASDSYLLSGTPVGRLQRATFETANRLIKSYPKRDFDYPDMELDGKRYPVTETVVRRMPFCKLLNFRRQGLPKNAPRVLFVAAISGHHATLSLETYQEFLPDYDVYVTDWEDARNVPLSDGRFGLEDYVDYLTGFLEIIGRNTHMFALCQAAVPALVATAVMAEQGSAFRPRSLTVMAGPIDVRINPTSFIERAQLMKAFKPLLKATAIHRVPGRFPGAGRKVYPGVMQLSGFMAMNAGMHLDKHFQFFTDVATGDEESAQKHRDFYNEYYALMDATEEFYLETLDSVFFDQKLAKGTWVHRGKPVDCRHITDVPLFALEGEEDHMVAVGQCEAALHLCTRLPNEMKQSHVQQGVGHYGIFQGELFRSETAPLIKEFITRHSASRRKR